MKSTQVPGARVNELRYVVVNPKFPGLPLRGTPPATLVQNVNGFGGYSNRDFIYLQLRRTASNG